jgi:hypothetical protein
LWTTVLSPGDQQFVVDRHVMVEKKGLPGGLTTLTADHAEAAAHAGDETKADQLSPAVNAATPLRHFVRRLNRFIPLPPTARYGCSLRLPAQAQHHNRSASRSRSPGVKERARSVDGDVA